MRIPKKEYERALNRAAEGLTTEIDIGSVSYAIFGTYGLSINYPKKTKDGVSLLGKWIADWKNKSLAQINNEIKNQDWR